MQPVRDTMGDHSRRRFLRTAGILSLVGLAGCPSDSSDQTTAPSQTTRPHHTTTTTETTTTPSNPEDMFTDDPLDFERETFEDVVRPVGVIRDGADVQVLGEDVLETSWALRTDVDQLKFEVVLGGEEGEVEVSGREEDVERGDDLVRGSWTMEASNVQPGETNLRFFAWRESEDGDEQLIDSSGIWDIEIENFPYKLDIRDEVGTLGGNFDSYRTEREWDDFPTKRTEKEWWDMYWNDIQPDLEEQSGVGVGQLSDIESFFRDRGFAESPKTAEERAKALFEGIATYIYEQTDIASSAESKAVFYAAERGLARDIWGMEEDEYFATWIRGNASSHEINFIAFDANAHLETEEEDWQLRFHNTHAVSDEENWNDTYNGGTPSAYAKPEESPYRADFPEKDRFMDAFNYEKLHKKASLTDDNHYETVKIHRQPASSLVRMVDASDNDITDDVTGLANNVVFERDYLKSLEEATKNENFTHEVLDNLIEAGRLIYETAEDLDLENDYIAIGGTLGDEKAPVRINEEQYWNAVNSFDYNPDEHTYDSWDEVVPPNPLNDVGKFLDGSNTFQ